MSLVESYNDSGLAVITLNSSKSGNRLNTNSLTALSHAINAAILDDETRVIMIRSNGKNFCLGMDLEFLQSTGAEKSTAEMSVELYADLLLKIYEAPKPVIALVHGDVKAGGIGLMGACDIIIASENSTFELSEVLLGLIPANVLPFIFSLRLTPQKARYLVLTAKRLKAIEAQNLGLIDEYAPEDKLERKVKGILKTLFRAEPNAIAETKHFTQALLSKNLDEASNMAREKIIELMRNPKVLEGISAFNEGSTPKWFGKFRPKNPLICEENNE